ncbi:MAG: histidine phosphatase family protein [Rhodothermales bacterium]
MAQGDSLPVAVHLVRHGRVASHRGDIPITEEGRVEIAAAGRGLAVGLRRDEDVHFLTTPTRRTKETADVLRASMRAAHGEGAGFLEPREEWAIRNPDLFLAGRRVEMVSTPEAMAGQIPETGIDAAGVDAVAFFHAFFRSPDRIGYWMAQPDPPGEDVTAVARRIVAFCMSLLYVPTHRRRRFVCVTHSPVLRAVLQHYTHQDPGEPEYGESIDLHLDPRESTVTFRGLTMPLRV